MLYSHIKFDTVEAIEYYLVERKSIHQNCDGKISPMQVQINLKILNALFSYVSYRIKRIIFLTI